VRLTRLLSFIYLLKSVNFKIFQIMWIYVCWFALIESFLCVVLDRILISIGESFGVSDGKHLLNFQTI